RDARPGGGRSRTDRGRAAARIARSRDSHRTDRLRARHAHGPPSRGSGVPQEITDFSSPLAGEVGGKGAGWGDRAAHDAWLETSTSPLAGEGGGVVAGWGARSEHDAWLETFTSPFAGEVGGVAAGWGARSEHDAWLETFTSPLAGGGRRRRRRVGR